MTKKINCVVCNQKRLLLSKLLCVEKKRKYYFIKKLNNAFENKHNCFFFCTKCPDLYFMSGALFEFNTDNSKH